MAISGDNVHVLLADQGLDVIDIPTLHIIGCSDPYVLGAIALYNMCDQNSAEMFDHGKGHTVPRDARTIQELCDAIDRLSTRENWQDNELTVTGLQAVDPSNVESWEATKRELAVTE